MVTWKKTVCFEVKLNVLYSVDRHMGIHIFLAKWLGLSVSTVNPVVRNVRVSLLILNCNHSYLAREQERYCKNKIACWLSYVVLSVQRTFLFMLSYTLQIQNYIFCGGQSDLFPSGFLCTCYWYYFMFCKFEAETLCNIDCLFSLRRDQDYNL
jgi:hypothetical protein